MEYSSWLACTSQSLLAAHGSWVGAGTYERPTSGRDAPCQTGRCSTHRWPPLTAGKERADMPTSLFHSDVHEPELYATGWLQLARFLPSLLNRGALGRRWIGLMAARARPPAPMKPWQPTLHLAAGHSEVGHSVPETALILIMSRSSFCIAFLCAVVCMYRNQAGYVWWCYIQQKFPE